MEKNYVKDMCALAGWYWLFSFILDQCVALGVGFYSVCENKMLVCVIAAACYATLYWVLGRRFLQRRLQPQGFDYRLSLCLLSLPAVASCITVVVYMFGYVPLPWQSSWTERLMAAVAVDVIRYFVDLAVLCLCKKVSASIGSK